MQHNLQCGVRNALCLSNKNNFGLRPCMIFGFDISIVKQ